MNGSSLTLEDVLAAARCIALGARNGRDPGKVARAIRAAAGIALIERLGTGRAHPRYGDGSLSAASLALSPTAPTAPPITVPELLAALGVLADVWAETAGTGQRS